jgi:hypothetical protein
MTNVDAIKSVISSREGPAHGALFRVTLPSISSATSFLDTGSREIDVLCTNVTMPGRQVMTQLRRIGVQTQKIAYDQAYDDVTMTFRLMNDYGAKKYFEVWQELAVNPSTGEIGYATDYLQQVKIQQLKKGASFPIFNRSLGIPALPPEITNRLPKVGPFDLAQGEFDLDLILGAKTIYTCTLIDAFPTSVQAIQLGDGQTNQLIEMQVSMSYKKWTGDAGSPSSQFERLATVGLGAVTSRLF